MKNDFLKFPQEYEVGKQIRDQFLASSTVTPGRKRIIEERVTDIEILYDIHMEDHTEMIVVFVGIDKTTDDYTERNVVMAIASSFPHYSMVVLHNGLSAKVFALESEKQSRNTRRMSVKKMHMSFKFNYKKLKSKDKKFFEALGECINKSRTSQGLSAKWCNIIDKEWEAHKEKIKSGYYLEQEIMNECIKEEDWIIYLDSLDFERDREYEEYWRFESEIPYDYDDE